MSACEPAGMAVIPAHGASLRITVQPVPSDQFFKRILDMLRWNRHLLQTDFITGEEEWCAPNRQDQHGQYPGLRLSDRAGHAPLVVAANHPIRPSLLWNRVHVGIDVG